jgi:hypothetical protein
MSCLEVKSGASRDSLGLLWKSRIRLKGICLNLDTYFLDGGFLLFDECIQIYPSSSGCVYVLRKIAHTEVAVIILQCWRRAEEH